MAACAYLPSVECVDHYLIVLGFVISLKRDVAMQNSSHGIVLILCLIEMDLFLMTGIVWLLAQVILCRERRTCSTNKDAAGKGYR